MTKKHYGMLFAIFFVMITGIFYSCSTKEKDVYLQKKNDSYESEGLLQEDEVTKIEDDKTEVVDTKNQEEKQQISCEKDAQESWGNARESSNDLIYIHICGAVKNPGVYEVMDGSRLFEAIELAGGLSKNAAEDYVNLAQVITDGTKYDIPTTDEVTKEDYLNQVEVKQANEGTKSKGSDSKLQVNINTADIDGLCQIPGIGETKAKNIIAYREEHGKFQVVDDIMNVTGIGEKTFEKIKHYLIP